VLDEAGAADVEKLRPADLRHEWPPIGVPEIEHIVARMARVPRAGGVERRQARRCSSLDGELKAVIYGQDQAIDDVTSAIKLARSGLRAPDKPIGSFLFAGPTGVGKTELARQLARVLKVEFLRFDMSEYMEKHAVSRLIGAPPGIRRLRGGRAADRRHPQVAACRAAARRDREGASRISSPSCCR
jgi:ATP-dependent Clp protease ATP-binding subunit ClpA